MANHLRRALLCCAALALLAPAAASADSANPGVTVPTDLDANSALVSYALPVSSPTGAFIGAPTCTPAPGTRFALGSTPVTCTGMVAGPPGPCIFIDPLHPELGCVPMPPIPLPATTTFAVTVVDGQNPVWGTASDVAQTLSGDATSGVVTYAAPAATDNVGVVSSGCEPASGSTFPLGTTTVTCTAKDAAGRTGVRTFTVTLSAPARETPAAPATQEEAPAVTSPVPDVHPPTTPVAKTCRVPKLAGLTLAAAKARLKAAGCTTGKVTRKKAARAKRGRVVSQSVRGGATKPAGTAVRLGVGR